MPQHFTLCLLLTDKTYTLSLNSVNLLKNQVGSLLAKKNQFFKHIILSCF